MRVDSLEPLQVLTNKVRSSKVRWWSANNRNALSNRRFDENLTEKYLWCRLTICTSLKLISPLPTSARKARSLAVYISMQDSRCMQGWSVSSIASLTYDISLRQTLTTPAAQHLCDRQMLLRSISDWSANFMTFGELERECLGWHEGIPTTHTRYLRNHSEKLKYYSTGHACLPRHLQVSTEVETPIHDSIRE
jgi:hypothetical protein